MAGDTGLSERAYAVHRKEKGLPGGNRNAVSAALKSGRIRRNAEGRIDPDEADQDWEANTSEAKRTDRAGTPSTYQEARAIREVLNARITRLEYEEKLGKLVSASEVKEQAFRRGRVLRDRLLALPGRLAADVAAETRLKKVEARLTEALREVLEEFEGEGEADE